jgi:hypothetical protein
VVTIRGGHVDREVKTLMEHRKILRCNGAVIHVVPWTTTCLLWVILGFETYEHGNYERAGGFDLLKVSIPVENSVRG